MRRKTECTPFTSRPCWFRIAARSQPPPSTENPGTVARMGRSGRLRVARAHRGPVPGTSCVPSVILPASLALLPVCPRTAPMTPTRMTDTQWLRIRSWLDTCSGIRVGKDAQGRLCVEALRWMARMGARGRPRTGRGNRSTAVMRPGATKASDRACWPICRPLQICPPCDWTARSGARPKKEAEPALGRSWGGFGTQIPILADRRDRPLRLCVTAGQRHDRTRALGEAGIDAPRSGPRIGPGIATPAAPGGRQDIKAVLPARSRRTNPQPRNGIRRAMPGHGASTGSKDGAAWPGFSVLDGDLDRAEILLQHCLGYRAGRRYLHRRAIKAGAVISLDAA